MFPCFHMLLSVTYWQCIHTFVRLNKCFHVLLSVTCWLCKNHWWYAWWLIFSVICRWRMIWIVSVMRRVSRSWWTVSGSSARMPLSWWIEQEEDSRSVRSRSQHTYCMLHIKRNLLIKLINIYCFKHWWEIVKHRKNSDVNYNNLFPILNLSDC